MVQKNRKAQGWGFDLMIGVIIFEIAIVAFFLYSINSTEETEQSISSLNYEANNIANSLLSEGYPAEWTEADVSKIGLLSNNKINETKLSQFYSLSLSDYSRTKLLLNTKKDYYISFSENITLNNNSISHIGYLPANPQNLIKATRLASYNNRPIPIYVNVWD